MSFLEKLWVNNWPQYVFHRYFWFYPRLQHLELPAGSKILEIGSGVGMTSNFIATKFPESELMATDFDQTQVNTAKAKITRKNVRFQQEDAAELSFSDNSFETCFAVLTFHHIENFPQTVKEVYRILKPGGRLFVLDIPAKTWNPILRWVRLIGRFRFGTPGMFSKDEFVELLQETGFKIVFEKSKFWFWIECQKV